MLSVDFVSNLSDLYNIENLNSDIYLLQLGVAIIANSVRLTYGIVSAMSGLMLAYFEKPESEIKMDVNSGSWFGRIIFFSR